MIKRNIYKWGCFLCMTLGVMVNMACSDDDNSSGAELSFSRSIYILPSFGSLEVELRVSQAPATTLVVPVQIEGSAVLGEDYEVSGKEFVFQPNATSATLQFTPKDNLTEGREIRLSISPVEGYRLGSKKVAMIPVETKERIMYSFTSSYSRMLSEVEVWVELQGEISGKSYRAPSDISIPIEVAPSSTAVLGTDFELPASMTSVTIPANSRNTRFVVKVAEDAEDYAGKEAILNLKAPTENTAMFYPGSFSSYILKLDQVKFTDMLGKWKPVEITSYDAYIMGEIPEEDWAYSLPENNDDGDYLEFVHEEDGTDRIIPHLTGDLKSYFCNPEGHKVVFDHVEKNIIDWGTFEYYDAPYYIISQVNKLFSRSKLELGDVFLGIDKIDDNNIVLYFHEYIPTDFFSQTYKDYGDWFSADFFGITYTFTRIE